jgi:serine/threonine-protein kinase
LWLTRFRLPDIIAGDSGKSSLFQEVRVIMPLNTGHVLNNRYRIVSLLGQGGFGAVYRAWDVNLNKPCALKENLGTSPDEQRQFIREASMLANISHPNLPRVTDYFSLPDQGQYLVMDFVDGQDLSEMLNERGPLPEDQALFWVGQICDALNYLHMQDPPIIHRDIKPSNIKITPSGKAILVDFGIAKMYSPTKQTTVGARAVTPGYSPVEQYGQGTTDARTDVYALGATFYSLLTGQVPPESIQIKMGTPLILPRALNSTISENTNNAILKAMQVEPENRFEGAADFKEALTPYGSWANATVQVASTPAGASQWGAEAARPPSQPAPVAPTVVARAVEVPTAEGLIPPETTQRRTPWIWIGAAGCLVVMILVSICGVGGYLVFRQPDNAEQATNTPAATNTSAIAVQPTPTTLVSTPTGASPTEPSFTPTTAPTATSSLGNPNASVSGEEFFATQFDDIENWYPITIPETTDYVVEARHGTLYIQVNPVKTTVYNFYDFFLENPDVRVEAAVETVAGPNTNNISLVCRASDKGWYEFSMTSGGYWYIWIYDSEDGFTELTRGASYAINLKKAKNQIAATCIGTDLTFYVNGTLMGSASDTTFQDAGQVGVSVSTFDFPGAGVEFDWLSATVP